MAITVTDLLIRVKADVAGAESALSSMRGGIASLGILAGVVAAGEFIKLGMEAQTQLSIVAGLTGSTQAQMAGYTAGLEGYATRFGMSLDEAAKGLYYVVSAGFQGKDAMTVLQAAMLHAAATGVDLQEVANGLTSAMNAYGAGANQASHYSDILTTAITYGKQTTADFAQNVSKAALMAASAHVPFEQLAAAETALTQKGEPANRAFTELSFMMSKIAVPSADAMAKSVHGLGGHLDATKYQSADLMGKLLLLRNSTGLNEDEFLKLVGGTRSARGALGLLSDQGVAYYKVLDKMKTNSGVTNTAFETMTKTMGFGFRQVGAAISVAAFEFVKFITPAVLPFLKNVATGIVDITTHTQKFAPLIGGVAAAAVMLLGVAMWFLAGAVIATAGPFLLAGAAIGLLVGGLIYAYQHFKGFHDVVNSVGAALRTGFATAVKLGGQAMAFLHPYIVLALTTLMQLGGFIKATFLPVFQQIVATVKGQIIPAFQSLMPFLAQMGPLFQFIGKIIGGVVVVALALLVGALNAGMQGFAGLLTGLSVAFGGIVQIVVGIVQVIIAIFSGFFAILTDVFTGNWGKIAADSTKLLTNLGTGIWNILQGIFNVVIGIFSGAVLLIAGIVTGFVQGIIGFFQHLADAIVGHSIIPDMINGILSWFQRIVQAVQIIASFVVGIISQFISLGVRVIATVVNFVVGVISQFISLEARGIALIISFITGVLSTIRGAIGQAASAMGAVKDGILGALGDLGGRLASLITGAIKNMIGAIGGMAGSVAGAFGNLFAGLHMPHFASGGTMAGSGLALVGENGPEVVALPGGASVFPHGAIAGAGGGGGSGTMVIHVHSHNYLDGRELTQSVLKNLPAVGRLATGRRDA